MIRRSEERDIPALDKLLYQVHDLHATGRPDLFQKGCKKYTDEELRNILRDESTPVFVYTDEADVPVGYAFCIYREYDGSGSLTQRKELYIDDLCVDSACRGRGIGSALYAFVLEEAKRSGCLHVTLNVWNCNEGAMRFYEKLGMQPLKVYMEQKL